MRTWSILEDGKVVASYEGFNKECIEQANCVALVKQYGELHVYALDNEYNLDGLHKYIKDEKYTLVGVYNKLAQPTSRCC